jgi:hypothetical protein
LARIPFEIDTQSIKREADACAQDVGRMMDAALDRPLARLRKRLNAGDIITSLLQRTSVRTLVQDWLRRPKL